MMESGVKPVYVFDGKPPQLKGGELAKRLAKREKVRVLLITTFSPSYCNLHYLNIHNLRPKLT
jgi:5'-3' exonuclease